MLLLGGNLCPRANVCVRVRVLTCDFEEKCDEMVLLRCVPLLHCIKIGWR